MRFLEEFSLYEDKWTDLNYMNNLKEQFNDATENIHYIRGDKSFGHNRENNPNLAIPYKENIYEFYPTFSKISNIEDRDVFIQTSISLRQINKEGGYDVYVRYLEKERYIKYNINSKIIHFWTKNIVLLIPNNKSILNIPIVDGENKFFNKLFLGLPITKAKLTEKEDKYLEPILDSWNEPMNLEYGKQMMPDKIDLFNLYLSMEPELSSNLGSPSLMIYKQWSLKLRDKLPELSEILDYSSQNKNYENLESKPYWIFSSGSLSHATSILVVTKSNIIKEGCYYVNTGEGVLYHKTKNGLFNTIIWHDLINVTNKIKRWNSIGQSLFDGNFHGAYQSFNKGLDWIVSNNSIIDSKNFKETPKVTSGKILEWLKWNVVENTLYMSTQVKGTCSFQSILHPLFLISIDLGIEEKFISTLLETRDEFVKNVPNNNFWITHCINTMYNTHHTLKFPSIEYKDISYDSIVVPQKIDPTNIYLRNLIKLKSSCVDYQTIFNLLRKEKIDYWMIGGNNFYRNKLSTIIINYIIPIIKKTDIKITDEDWKVWSHLLKNEYIYALNEESKISIIYLAIVLNFKSANQFEVTIKFRDFYLRSIYKQWTSSNIGNFLYIESCELYDIPYEDYLWIDFWNKFPRIYIHTQDIQRNLVSDFLTEGDNKNCKSIKDLMSSISVSLSKDHRKRMISALGCYTTDNITVGSSGYTKFLDIANILTYTSADYSYFIENINKIRIYPSMDETLIYLKSISKVAEEINKKALFSYRILADTKELFVGENIKLRDFWYDKFSILSPYLYELKDYPIFTTLVIVIGMSTGSKRLKELRERYKNIRPIKKTSTTLKEELTLWIYHELFDLKYEDLSMKTIDSLNQNINLSVKGRIEYDKDKIIYTLSAIIKNILDEEKYISLNSESFTLEDLGRLTDVYYNKHKEEFEVSFLEEDGQIKFKGELVYHHTTDSYLSNIYSSTHNINAIILLEDSLVILEHNIIIKRKNEKYYLIDNDQELEIDRNSNRFTRWITPSGLNFVVKKGNSRLLYTILHQVKIDGGSKIFSNNLVKYEDIDIFNSSRKSELSISMFHPSGLFFLNFSITHLLHIALLTIINSWPTLIYIMPLIATYDFKLSSDDKNVLSLIKLYTSTHSIDTPYNNYWDSYLYGRVSNGWNDGKFYMPYKIFEEGKYDIDFSFLEDFRKENFSKLYQETELELEKYLINIQPLFRITSSSKLVILIHKLSLLYRLIETEEYNAETLTSLYSKSIGYYGPRPMSFLLQEIRSCYLISWDQYKLYNRLIDSKIVQQAVMGIGKSSTIIPLLIMKNGYGRLNIIQPTHLVNQSISSLSGVFIFYNKNEAFWGHEKHPYSKLSINISDDTYIKKSILKDPIQFRENNFIMDEFDSMYNPLTSEYNIPLEYTSHPLSEKLFLKDIYLYPNQKLYLYSDKNYYLATVNNDKEIIVETDEKFEINYAKDYNFMLNYMSILSSFVDGNIVKSNLPPILIQKLMSDISLILINSVYLKDYGFDNKSLLAVPYRSLNTPASGSSFSDVDIVMITTLLSLKYSGPQKQHYDSLLNSKLLNESQISKVKNSSYDEDIKKILIEKILPMSIKYSRYKYNVSFMDLIENSFSKTRYAFSGTLNLKLPISKCPDYYFKDISHWQGVSDIKPQDETIVDIIKKSKVVNISKTEAIIDYFNKNKFNCLLDPAVLFRDIPNKDVAKKLKNDINRVVYFDPMDDSPMVDDSSFNTVLCQKEENKCYFYYDQKHCVGTDVKQPTNMLGLCCVSDINNLTEISQAMFRMRKILTGKHIVIFAYSGTSDIKSGLELYDMLNKNEKRNLEGKNKIQVLQELNVCKRSNESFSEDSYKTINYYEPLDKSYSNWIKNIYEKEFQLTGLPIITKGNILATEQEQEQELVRVEEDFEFEICNLPSIPGIENYWSCSYLEGILLSKRFKDEYYFGRSMPIEYEFDICQILLRDDYVYVMTNGEMLNINKEFRNIREDDSLKVKENFYFAKFVFGYVLDAKQQFLILDKIDQNISLVKETLYFQLDKLSLVIPYSWLKYYILDPSVLDANYHLFKGLSQKEIDRIMKKNKYSEKKIVEIGKKWRFE